MTFDLQRALADLKVKADWMGLRERHETGSFIGARNGKVEANQSFASRGVMVEVLSDGCLGYAATNCLDQVSLQRAAERAKGQADMLARFCLHPFDPGVRPRVVGSYQGPEVATGPARAELNEGLMAISARMKVAEQIVDASAQLHLSTEESRLVATNGTDLYQRQPIFCLHYAAVAQAGTVSQRRSNGGMGVSCFRGGLERWDREGELTKAERVGREALELLAAPECPVATMDLVLSPTQMVLQIHESVGHPLELDRILGDERNYAGGSFVKLEDFGRRRYGSDLMNISFDPSIAGELASYDFDDTGQAAARDFVIKEGLLLRALGSGESQQRSGIPGVACARACSWNRPPIDRMANLNLEPGASRTAAIIGAVDYGVYMDGNRSWSIDDFRNKFQFGCEYGRMIRQGELAEVVRNPNYRGISSIFWQNLAMVGDRDSWRYLGIMTCGKGEPNQLVRVGHAAPLCLFNQVEVFGGV